MAGGSPRNRFWSDWGGKDNHQVYISGLAHHRLTNEGIVDHVVDSESHVAEMDSLSEN